MSGQHCSNQDEQCTFMGLLDAPHRTTMILRTGIRREEFIALLLAGLRHSSHDDNDDDDDTDIPTYMPLFLGPGAVKDRWKSPPRP